jgi:hypothetical protein
LWVSLVWVGGILFIVSISLWLNCGMQWARRSSEVRYDGAIWVLSDDDLIRDWLVTPGE